VEIVEAHQAELGKTMEPVLELLRGGESLGLAMVKAGVPEHVRKKILGRFVIEELSDTLDSHYVLDAHGRYEGALAAQREVDMALSLLARLRKRVQVVGAVSILPFLVMLVLHGMHHEIPLFASSFAGFFLALVSIWKIPEMRKLALREARQEYAEYYFLFPLFLSITLLTSAGFFNGMQHLIHSGMQTLGQSHVAVTQFLGSTVLSAILDNNVVADFASRALSNLDVTILHLFAMSQIAGYALGGCWTHIGCAQSVVAYAFIQRDVDAQYTPVQWMKDMTPVIFQILIMIIVLIYAENVLLNSMH
jgi:hypothetical protein